MSDMSKKNAGPLSVTIIVAGLLLLGAGGAMVVRSERRTNKVPMSASPKPVTVIRAKEATYRRSRAYVGTLHPWVEANVGPQLVSAYVDTVLVRPGATVRRGDVLATLDCRNASAASSAIAMGARAVEARQRALANEATRTQKLLDRGYASANETEQLLAQSAAESAQLEAQRATLAKSSLEVGDCVLRAPFDGEIGDRFADPGTFVRPGSAIVSVIDRGTVRFAADAPEIDFAVVAPDTPVKIHADAVDLALEGKIARRAPHADRDTRTVHFEVDFPNPTHAIPVDTTAEVRIDYGDVIQVTELPLYAATVRGKRATVFTVVDEVVRAKSVAVVGELGGALFVDRAIEPNAAVVTEGRALVADGDRVDAKEADVKGAKL